ncbi:uncharacterized protein LAJ45_06511 [Morchella importuna]|nr:uncharacterized protein LAJ45_06511 [Morchella importuna]KAH8149432.1 hypothetical protein LAJ45_06511 [Morchella importuna]
MNPPLPCISTSSSSSSTTTSSEIIPRSASSSVKALSPDDFKSSSYPQYTQSPSLLARSSTSSGGASHIRSSRPHSPKITSSKPSSPIVAPRASNLSTSTPPSKCSTPPIAPTTPIAPPSRDDTGTLSPPKRARHMDPSIKALPQLYQHCPTNDLVYLISDMLLELVGLNDKIPLSGAGLTRFHSRAPPTISIPDYLSRLALHASLQPSILLSMVYYIDILSTHYSPFVVSSLTVHRFLITAATVASKGLCDSFLTNGFYAKVGGVSLMELNLLELEFLVRVGWRIVPKGEVLEEYYRSLIGRLQSKYIIEGAEEALGDTPGSSGSSAVAGVAGPAGS